VQQIAAWPSLLAYCKQDRISIGEDTGILVNSLKEVNSGGVTSPAWNITKLPTIGAYQVIS
jgi:hypothetical protein